MTKQDIYRELFWHGLVYIRNMQEQSFFKKGRDTSCYHVAELLHNLHASMFEKEFLDHDIWFINTQMRYFIEECSPKIFGSYPLFCDLLLLLLDAVPEEMKEKVNWSPSDETIMLVTEVRERAEADKGKPLLKGFTLCP